MKRILIVQALIKQYRLPFFESLHDSLKENNFKLKIAYGEPYGIEKTKLDNVELNESLGHKVKNHWFCNGRLLYQPLLKEIINADLIIVEQANKHIVNYFVLLLSIMGIKKVAFWGHGWNRQGNVSSFSEQLKKHFLNRADYWFAYTAGTAEYLKANGVSPDVITIVQNSVDVKSFKKLLTEVSEKDLTTARQILGIKRDTMVGLFCGSLYGEKKLPFLIEAAKVIKRRFAKFHLVILGAGPEGQFVERVAKEESWIHYLGPKFGKEKAIYFRLSNIFLNPGLVGLAILDAFAAGIPVMTTNIPVHSPEIEYLQNGINGMITPHEPLRYASSVIDILTNASLHSRLIEGAASDAKRYTLDAMVENFKNGILKCLNK